MRLPVVGGLRQPNVLFVSQHISEGWNPKAGYTRAVGGGLGSAGGAGHRLHHCEHQLLLVGGANAPREPLLLCCWAASQWQQANLNQGAGGLLAEGWGHICMHIVR